MKVLVGITYYHPNISGLTFYVERLSEGLINKGHIVSVLTSRYDKLLPNKELINGVRIVRSPVLFRLGKGVFMPFLLIDIIRLARQADVINCHLPQFESFLFAIVGKLLGKKVVFTHHTDLSGWKGIFNRISEVVLWSGQAVGSVFADKIVPYTKDYADNSWYLKLFKSKLAFSYPPIKVGAILKSQVKKWKSDLGNPKYIIGFSGRIAKQKGIPHLLKAIPYLKKEIGDFKIVFAGPYKEVIGEKYFNEINILVSKYKRYIHFLGKVSYEKMSSFYSMCDVLVLPSDDRLESFGIVQVEAMLSGCPVVASNLPGVRVPIGKTGMGIVTEPGDSPALATNIIKVLINKKKYIKPKARINRIFNYHKTIECYLELFSLS